MKAEKGVVLVTGGSGLIGRAVTAALSQSFRVIALDLKEPGKPVPDVEFVPMDVSRLKSVRYALNQVRSRYGEKIASVIHLAAYYSFSGEHSPRYDRITVRGTERLLRELKSFELEQFVFSSTMLVHAPSPGPGRKIDESWPLEPKWPYPKSKVDAEDIIRRQHGTIPYVVLRIAGVYDDRCHSVPIAHQIERIHEQHLTGHFYPGGLGKGQAFVHMNDLVEAIRSAVEKRKQLPEELTLLIGEPETMSYGEIQDTLGGLIHGEEWATLSIPKTTAKAGAWAQKWAQEKLPIGKEPFIKPWMVDLADDHYELDISRARKYLNWEPARSLRERLPTMVDFLRSDTTAFYRENKLSHPVTAAVTLRERIPQIALGGLLAGLVAYLAVRRFPQRAA